MVVRLERKISASFRESEFRCRCRSETCDAKPMRLEFIALLQALRDLWGRPMSPTSGARCAPHNAAVKGAPNSQHLLGNAADFWFIDPSSTRKFVELAEKIGFRGIGCGKHLVHLDSRDGEAKRWDYYD